MNKIWKGRNKKEKTSETVGAVTHTHTHTHTHGYNLKDTVPAQTGNQIKPKRTKIILPLIVLLALICVVAIVWAGFARPNEIAQIDRDENTDEEEISAETVTVNAGQSYTVPKTGIYKIELHGGKSQDFSGIQVGEISGLKGSKVTGYVSLIEGEKLDTTISSGGVGFGNNGSVSTLGSAGDGLILYKGDTALGYVSGGPGKTFASSHVWVYCDTCRDIWSTSMPNATWYPNPRDEERI